VKEGSAAAAVRVGNLDAHHSQLEEAVDERAGHFRLIVHFADQRPDFPLRKLEHALPEQGFVFRQAR
jgi:hypothetical protein